jgi:hypothetical protein
MSPKSSLVSRRAAVSGALATAASTLLPGPADAFLGLLLRFLTGSVGRAALGRAAIGRVIVRGAGPRVRRRTDWHLAHRLGQGASELLFSSPIDPRYGGYFGEGAEVAITRCRDRELVSLIGDNDAVPVVHPVQIQVMDYPATRAEAQFGTAAPFELIYPVHLLRALGDWGLALIEYHTVRGYVTIHVAQAGPDVMQAALRVVALSPAGRSIRGEFRSRRMARPLFFE